jgi:aspartyl/asparaginyl beta-hydroxylase (cupin superfamily)
MSCFTGEKVMKLSDSDTTGPVPSGTAPAEPPFWDDQLHHIPWCLSLLEQAESIRSEVLALIKDFRPFMPYPKYANLYNNTWDAFPLSIFQGEHIELSKEKLAVSMAPMIRMFRAHLPLTSSTIAPLEAEGHLRNVFVSRLIPGSVINPHRGWTQEFLRIHLCLIEDPGCRITVGADTRTWRQGQLLAFKDGGPYHHSVLHQGHQERIVLSYDLSLRYAARFIAGLFAEDDVAKYAEPSRTGQTRGV